MTDPNAPRLPWDEVLSIVPFPLPPDSPFETAMREASAAEQAMLDARVADLLKPGTPPAHSYTTGGASTVSGPVDVAGLLALMRPLEERRRKIDQGLIDGLWNLMWDTIRKLVGKITGDRNSIVHWRAGIHPSAKELRLTVPRLERIEEIERDGNNYFNSAKLKEFIAKCEFVRKHLDKFVMLQFWMKELGPKVEPGYFQSWQDIYRQAIAFPTPNPGPPGPTDEEPASPPRPSRA